MKHYSDHPNMRELFNCEIGLSDPWGWDLSIIQLNTTNAMSEFRGKSLAPCA